MGMKIFGSVCAALLSGLVMANPSAQQAELDAACEAARERALAPMRAH